MKAFSYSYAYEQLEILAVLKSFCLSDTHAYGFRTKRLESFH